MSPDVSAQIIAQAWLDESFAQALCGPDAYTAIRKTLGVELPEGTPLPEIPPAPSESIEGLGISTALAAGQVSSRTANSTLDSSSGATKSSCAGK